MNPCGCGCGELVRKRFHIGHNRRGVTDPRYKLKYANVRGYVFVRAPKHPNANNQGYVREHILVAERALGRILPEKCEIHHVNENKSDNRPSNLVICQDRA